MSTSVGTLPDSLVRHRQAFAQFATHETDEWEHSADAKRLYALYDGWNAQFFDGQLVVAHILLSEPKSARAYGDTATFSGWGSRAQIRIRPSLLMGTHRDVRSGPEYAEGRFRFCADVLWHEMIHQHALEVSFTSEDGWHGHGPHFRDTCNRIGAALGLGRVRTSKRRGPDKDLPSCAQWPHNVRPPEYYLGALADPPPPEPTVPPVPRVCATCEKVAAMVDEALARFQLTRGMSQLERYRLVVETLRAIRDVLPIDGDAE